MSRWLVTGGSGFLGINLIRALVEKGNEVISIDIAPFLYPDMADRIDHRIVDIMGSSQLKLPLYLQTVLRT